jgi:RNA polymerase sigma factor (sigma-70 family)
VVSRTRQGASRNARQDVTEASRKRAAVETFARHEQALRRTATRYSLCADDADDALQRALEILLVKAPSDDPRELVRWTQTVVKHEALAVRRERERILSGPAAAPPREEAEDWVASIPAHADGPAEQVERREAVARSREALQALKPQELRALSLLAEGYSYAEIGRITGFSHTKINRSLAEGRARFRRLVSRSEEGQRCADLAPLLSAFCDGEAGPEDAATVREHLRACAGCRSTLRAYRAAPRAVAALAPVLPLWRVLRGRVHEALSALGSRVRGSESLTAQLGATGGGHGVGTATVAKALAICVGGVGATACVATGVIPTPFQLTSQEPTAVSRPLEPPGGGEHVPEAGVEPAGQPEESESREARNRKPSDPPQPAPPPASGSVGEMVEYAPPETVPAEAAPEPGGTATAPTPVSSGSGAGSAAGEFGP